jgi:hypothetical protein
MVLTDHCAVSGLMTTYFAVVVLPWGMYCLISALFAVHVSELLLGVLA